MQLWKASRSQSQGCVVILGMVSFIPSQSGALGVLWADERPAPTAVLMRPCWPSAGPRATQPGGQRVLAWTWVPVRWLEVTGSGTGFEHGADRV